MRPAPNIGAGRFYWEGNGMKWRYLPFVVIGWVLGELTRDWWRQLWQ